MARKPRPERIYRIEQYDLREGSTYMNSTSQYLNRPPWWPGVGVKVENGVRTVYLEGVITWG